MDNTEAVAYWESQGCASSPREQTALFAQLAQQNADLTRQVASLAEQVAALTTMIAQSKKPLADASQQRKKQQKTLPAKRIVATKQQSDIDTEKSVAINPKIMAIVRRLSALEACTGIAPADMYAVIQAHQQGVKKSAIYQHLGWGSAKHTRIVKPVIDALVSSKVLQQAVIKAGIQQSVFFAEMRKEHRR